MRPSGRETPGARAPSRRPIARKRIAKGANVLRATQGPARPCRYILGCVSLARRRSRVALRAPNAVRVCRGWPRRERRSVGSEVETRGGSSAGRNFLLRLSDKKWTPPLSIEHGA